jgi:hypothetical protein
MLEIEQRRQQKRASRQRRLAKATLPQAIENNKTIAETRTIMPRKPSVGTKTSKQYGWMLCQPNGAPVLWADEPLRIKAMYTYITKKPASELAKDGFQIVRAAMQVEYLDD